MRTIQHHFTRRFFTHRGEQFRAELGSPQGYPRPRRELQNLPHLALVCARAALAREGDLVTGMGVSYLLAGQHTLTLTKRFLAVQTNTKVNWYRGQKVVDPVSGIDKEVRNVVMEEQVPVALEHAVSVEELGRDRVKYRIVTHLDVARGDNLDNFEVISVVDLFGLKLLEVM